MASGFQHLDFWFPVQFSGTSFFTSHDIQSLMICDPFDEPIGIKNPVADFQQQV
jgi:hypothetical protein